MSVAVTVRLLHGSIRAMGRSDAALMGAADESTIEWPPSPARVVAALVGGGGSSEWRRIDGDDSEIRALERAGAPRIEADAVADVIATPLVSRFVVVDKNDTGIVQNYPARKSAENRPGVRAHPRHPELRYVWDDVQLSTEEQRALRRRAGRVGYLGASDSPASISVSFDEEVTLDPSRVWAPDEHGSTLVSVPYEGMLDALDRAYGEMQEGRTVVGATLRREFEAFRPPRAAPPAHVASIGGTRLWFSFDRPLSGHRVLRVAEALKGLVLAQFAPRGEPGDAPAVLTGHNVEHGSPHARYWPLPFVGHRHANGKLFGACIWLPDSVDAALELRLRSALDGATLRVAGAPPVRLSTYDGTSRNITSRPSMWERESKEWASVTPVVFERFSKRPPTLDEVATWCAYEGLPRPVSVEVARLPFVPGGLDLRPHQVTRADGPRRPYGHLRIRFADLVRGPFALGRARSFGLGLMAAVAGAAPRAEPDGVDAKEGER